MRKKINLIFLYVINIIFLMIFQSCSTYSLNINKQHIEKNGYLIKNVNVFTAIHGKELLENVNVYIKNKIIVKISADPIEIIGVKIIDGQGKTLIPGLIDFHTHISSGTFIPWKPVMLPTMDFNFKACLYSGITSVVDMGGKMPEDMYSIVKDIDEGKKLAPHLFFPGIGFTALNSHPIPFVQRIKEIVPSSLSSFVPDLAYQITSETDMDKLDKHLNSHPDFTKVFLDDIPLNTPKMTLPVLKEIVRRSHAKNIPIIIHIGRNEDLKMVIESGADGVAHNVYKEKLDPKIAEELALKKIFVVPTIYVWHSYDLFANKHSTKHYTKLELETIHPLRLKELMNPFPSSYKEKSIWNAWNNAIGEYTKNLYPNLAILKEAGVIILSGTDTPCEGLSPGGSLHVELEHFVNAGLTPTEALIASTSAPSKILRNVFHKNINFGTIEEGKDADLVLVNGDPTKNIKDTQNIIAVFLQGRLLERNTPKM
ncbi:MAG: hypothetical protein A2086_13420 [Spirochaetes bacterium GWD1_27_9]|nr:MAG: hypothetical protein A2Z98_02105 [Spirochaetes bacterium GWB1_27_13]OHD23094.1 MAG: hypothetical protein A2Y34_16905 [Spirochaetes bacterium GWC1_27_15]OHD39906.1 MAG: hypothetical protein A2086_13420 [Spirochaetes bacterium GWD1_27_9]